MILCTVRQVHFVYLFHSLSTTGGFFCVLVSGGKGSGSRKGGPRWKLFQHGAAHPHLAEQADAYCSLFVCIFVLIATASRRAKWVQASQAYKRPSSLRVTLSLIWHECYGSKLKDGPQKSTCKQISTKSAILWNLTSFQSTFLNLCISIVMMMVQGPQGQ